MVGVESRYSPVGMHSASAPRQRGAVAIVVAVSLVAALVMVGLMIDLGKMFVQRSAMQTAADACALAAVGQLDKTVQGVNRAETVGLTIASRNLSGELTTATTTVRFGYDPATDTSTWGAAGSGTRNATHVACTVSHPALAMSRLLSGITSLGVTVKAMATLQGAAGACAIPLAICAKETATTTPGASSCSCPSGVTTAKAAQCVSTTQSCATRSAAGSINCTAGNNGGACTTATTSSSTSYVAETAANSWGHTFGQWIFSPPNSSSITDLVTGTGTSGSFGWASIDGKNGSRNLAEAITGPGFCDIDVNSPEITRDLEIGDTGKRQALMKAWNTRFGIFESSSCSAGATGGAAMLGTEPDFTGWAFEASNSKYPPLVAGTDIRRTYDRTTCGSGLGAGEPCNFLQARTENKAYSGSGSCVYSQTDLQAYGKNRRLVLAPVVQCSDWASGTSTQQARVLGWACALMVKDMRTGEPTVLEFLGSANDSSSPCQQSGVPTRNSTAGRVAVLVQ